MTQWTDQQQQQIAEQAYPPQGKDGKKKPYKKGDELHVNNNPKGPVLGYVATAINDNDGTQAYVLVDKDPKTTPPDQQTHITVMYQGSDFDQNKVDWTGTDIPEGIGILTGNKPGQVPSQLTTSSQTLQQALHDYPNAQADVYGHSLGSMDGQYALADLPVAMQKRIAGAHLYEGPNMYTALNAKQQRNAKRLTASGKIYNYVDPQDPVGIGYGKGKPSVGTWYKLDTNHKGLPSSLSIAGMVAGFLEGGPGLLGMANSAYSLIGGHIYPQHMFGGYKFDNGKLIIKPDLDSIWTSVDAGRDVLKDDEQAFKKANSGKLTKDEKIWMDEQQAGIMTQGMRELVSDEQTEFNALFDQACDTADENWKNTLSDARAIGSHLSDDEIATALKQGGATKHTIAGAPKQHYSDKKTKFSTAASTFTDLAGQIDSATNQLVSQDQQLAEQLEALG